jgi:hypothetical protein
MNNYLGLWNQYLTPIFEPWETAYSSIAFPPLYSPSWFSFGVSSFILAILLIVTGILIGIGFYGLHTEGGGAMSVVGLISSVVGFTLGALLIIIGNLTTGYTYAGIFLELSIVPVLPVLIPNFSFIGLGFVVLGFTLVLIGSASISASVRDMTESPSVCSAAGIISIVGALAFFFGSFMFGSAGVISGLNTSGGYVLGFGLIFIFVAFILWAVVFYSFRNM